MHELKFKKYWLGIGWFLIALIWYLSLTPAPMPDMGMDNSDKLGHFLAYGVLMGWFAQIYFNLRIRMALVVTFIVMGIIIEYVQGMTDYRSFQYADMLADSLGVLLAFILAHGPLSRVLVRVEKQLIKQ
ncbi:MAG: VanZ family protein [Gammaproteobacteria bacterium]|nr:VanZ family protein [Gammaproteobacteria bacterium]